MIRALRRVVGAAAAAATLIAAVALLASRFRLLRHAHVVVVMPEGGFAHTVYGPDLMRRMFPGRRCVFIVLSEYGRHNRKVAALWRDVRVVFLPLNLALRIGRWSFWSSRRWTKARLPGVVRTLVRIVVPAGTQFLWLEDLYRSAPIPETLEGMESRLSLSYRSLLAYFHLLGKTTVERAGAPATWRAIVERRLRQIPLKGVRPAKTCCLYLRQKGADSSDMTSNRRVGSALADYLEAVRVLNGAGYQVWLVGEVPVPRALAEDFGGMLIDAPRLGISADIFSLYAATEADLFIGENGGGLLPPVLRGIPSLLLNAFPYGHAFPNAWVHYKTVRDERGELVHYGRLFSEHTHDWDLPGMTVHANSAEEITRAVTQFLEDVTAREEPQPGDDVLSGFPEHAMIRHVPTARVSRAFIELFEGEGGARAQRPPHHDGQTVSWAPDISAPEVR